MRAPESLGEHRPSEARLRSSGRADEATGEAERPAQAAGTNTPAGGGRRREHEPIDATQCAGKENCQDDHKCLTHDLWADLNTHIFNYLRSVTLSELVRNHQSAGGVSVIQVAERRPGTPSTVPA